VCALRQGDGPEHVEQITTTIEETRADGRFRVPFHPHYRTASATLLVELEERGYRHLVTPWFSPSASHDLGDVAVEPVRTLAFRALDADGAPIAGAFARVEGPYWSGRSEPTDTEGEGVIRFVPGRPSTVRVSAAGYRDRLVEIAPDEERVELVLEALAMLDVRLTGSAAALERMDRLVVTAAGALFVWSAADWDDGPAELQLDLGATPIPTRRHRDGVPFQAEYDARSDGFYRLAGIAPGVPLELEVPGDDGRVLAVRGTTLAPHEWQALEIELE
jgi:hypothetical protein